MNFALMFALALGIDYALFIVVRFRAALFGADAVAAWRRSPRRWTPPARPCCSPALTVLISLSAVMLVPCPAFRSMALGIMLAVIFVLAATLTLLPPCWPGSARGSTRLSLPLGALRRAPLAALRGLG